MSEKRPGSSNKSGRIETARQKLRHQICIGLAFQLTMLIAGSFCAAQACGGGGLPQCTIGGDGPQPCDPSPIVIDTTGDGYHFTSASLGVVFDITGTGVPLMISWTELGSGVGFLALDRNGDGIINSGKELFGNYTEQKPSADPNGFLALAVYDDPSEGGNSDGVIDARDTVFSKLRLWIDSNHDGISQPEELHTLSSLGVNSIDLTVHQSGRRDQYGNIFRYRAKLNSLAPPSDRSMVALFAFDIFLTTENSLMASTGMDFPGLLRLSRSSRAQDTPWKRISSFDWGKACREYGGM